MENGIWHYDGMSFTNFKMEQGLAGNGIRSIVEDKLGTSGLQHPAEVELVNTTANLLPIIPLIKDC